MSKLQGIWSLMVMGLGGILLSSSAMAATVVVPANADGVTIILDGGGNLAVGVIATANIGALQVTDAKINDVATTKLTGVLAAAQHPALTGDVTSVAGALATTIAANAVTTAKILDANVTAAKMVNAGVFTGDVTTTFPAITIGANAITTAKILDANVTAAKMVNAGVFTGDVTTTFPAITIGANAITTAKINALAVTDAKINDVATTKLTGVLAAAQVPAFTGDVTTVAGALGTTIVANAVTTAKILDANVTTAKIADANVTTAKILDANVTTAKILDANVTAAKLAVGAVVLTSTAVTGVLPVANGGTGLATVGVNTNQPILGGTTATGNLQVVAVGTAGLPLVSVGAGAPTYATIADAAITSLATTKLTGALAAAQVPAFTGDVTTVAGALATTIANNAVTTVKINALAVTDAKINDVATTKLTGVLAAAQEPAHTGDVTNTAGSLATTIANNAVTTVKINALAVTDAKINDVATTKLTGVLAAAQEPAHTGDVTNTAGSLATTIANNAVTTAKINAGAVDLTTKVSGALPIANGGTGVVTGLTVLNGANITAGTVAAAALGTGAIDLSTAAVTGVLKTASIPTFSGDITGFGSSNTLNITSGAVTNAKLGLLSVATGNIQNLAVGTAQVADASITNAKIVSVDVSKITGGSVSTFASSNVGGDITIAAAVAPSTTLLASIGAGKVLDSMILQVGTGKLVGTITSSSLAGALPALNAAALTNLTATNIVGVVPAANLPITDLASASDVTGLLKDANIASVSASKVIGTITSGQIGAAAVNLTTQVTGVLPAANMAAISGDIVTVGNVATLQANAVTTVDIVNSAVTDAKINTVSAAKVFGTFTAGQIGVLAAASEPAHTGDVTNVAGSLALTIGASKVVDSMIATVSASKVTGALGASASVPASIITGIIPAANLTATNLTGAVTSVGAATTLSAGVVNDVNLGSVSFGKIIGTVSSIQIGAGAVLDASVVSLAASKLTGALPAIDGSKLTGVTAIPTGVYLRFPNNASHPAISGYTFAGTESVKLVKSVTNEKTGRVTNKTITVKVDVYQKN